MAGPVAPFRFPDGFRWSLRSVFEASDVSPTPDLVFVDPFSSSQVHALETTQHTPTKPRLLACDNAPATLASCEDVDDPDAGVLFRHSGWASLRRCVSDALESLADGDNRVDRFHNCGSHAWVMQSVEDANHYRITCNKCRDRFCTPCANDRAQHIANCVAAFAAQRELRLVTLTLRQTSATLKQDINRLYQSFAKLRRRRGWTATQRGGVYFCEVKRRRADDGWHIHLHALCEGVWLDKKWLSRTWHQITGDSFIVDIRFCRSSADAARYVAKYASKGVHGSCYHDPLVLREAIMAIKGRRLIGKFGTWSALDLKAEVETGDWHPVDTLSRLLRRSTSGEEFATHVLNMLRRQPCRDTGPSPPAPPPQSSFDYQENPDAPAVAHGCCQRSSSSGIPGRGARSASR